MQLLKLSLEEQPRKAYNGAECDSKTFNGLAGD